MPGADRDRAPIAVAPPGDPVVDESLTPAELASAMAAITSHELRSPLAMLMTLVETLRWRESTLSPADLDASLASMSSTLQRLHRLLDDLAVVQSREPSELKRTEVALAGAVGRAVADLSTEAHDVDVLVTGKAVIDGTMFERIISNLVRNAVVHTPSGTTISVQARAVEDGGCRIEVTDDGPGVTAEMRDHLFHPFRRGIDSRWRPGTGIGLTLVRQFARAHGGDATILDGPGFRVQVDLPGPVAAPGG